MTALPSDRMDAVKIIGVVLWCLGAPNSLSQDADEEHERLAAVLEREEADPVPRPAIVTLFRRQLPTTELSETLSARAGRDGSQERDPVPPATRLAGPTLREPRRPG